MTLSAEARAVLDRLAVSTSPSGLVEAALTLSTVHLGLTTLDPYRRHLDRLVGHVRDYLGDAASGDGDLDIWAEALTQVLSRRHGYVASPDGEWDSDDAVLTRVIDRRAGTPEALGILHLHVARAFGWQANALAYPARLLVRLERDGERLIIDPAGAGRAIAAEDMRAVLKAVRGNDAELEPRHSHSVDDRRVLLRLLIVLKGRLLRASRLREALAVIEAMLAVDPDHAGLWREAGLIHARLENLPAAVAALEEFLRHDEGDASRYQASILLQELRARMG